MEPHVVLILLAPLCLLAAFWTWIYGYVRTAQALARLAGAGLVITGIGGGALLWFYYVWPSQYEPSHGLNLLAGLFALVVLVVFGGIEAFGATWTLAICLVGLRRHAGGRAWFIVLLVGGVAPLVGGVLAMLFEEPLAAFIRLLAGPDAETVTVLGMIPYNVGPLFATITPLVAAIVTTVDAIHSAARAQPVPKWPVRVGEAMR